MSMILLPPQTCAEMLRNLVEVCLRKPVHSVQQIKLGVRFGVCCYRDSRIASEVFRPTFPKADVPNSSRGLILGRKKHTTTSTRPDRCVKYALPERFCATYLGYLVH